MTRPRDGSSDSGTGCYEVAQYAGQIWQRVFLQKESPRKVARDLGLSAYSVGKLCSACRQLGRMPSQRRLALCVMHQPDLSDSDIAEMFGRTTKWVEQVRQDAVRLRAEEPIRYETEFMDEGLKPADPTPEQITIRAEVCRSFWRDGVEGTKEVAT
jgi:hypothetical protein